jgi:hypothetical protein
LFVNAVLKNIDVVRIPEFQIKIIQVCLSIIYLKYGMRDRFDVLALGCNIQFQQSRKTFGLSEKHEDYIALEHVDGLNVVLTDYKYPPIGTTRHIQRMVNTMGIIITISSPSSSSPPSSW